MWPQPWGSSQAAAGQQAAVPALWRDLRRKCPSENVRAAAGPLSQDVCGRKAGNHGLAERSVDHAEALRHWSAGGRGRGKSRLSPSLLA